MLNLVLFIYTLGKLLLSENVVSLGNTYQSFISKNASQTRLPLKKYAPIT